MSDWFVTERPGSEWRLSPGIDNFSYALEIFRVPSSSTKKQERSKSHSFTVCMSVCVIPTMCQAIMEHSSLPDLSHL